MAIRINYNHSSSIAQRTLGSSQDLYARVAGRLASGMRINTSADDGVGMAVAERLRNQVRGLNAAGRNAQDGVSLIQTAQGALAETHSILGRLRELAVQAANDTLNATDRANLNAEANQLVSEVDRIAASTQFNATYLLTSGSAVSLTSGVKLQIGPNSTASANQITISATSVTSQDLTSGSSLGSSGSSGASNALSSVVSGITATGTQTFEVGGVPGVSYAPQSDTVTDLITAINSTTGTSGVTASLKNTKVRLEASSAKTITNDSGSTSGLIDNLFGVTSTGTLSNTVSGTTTLEDLGLTSSGTITFTTSAGSAGAINATSGAETLAELGVGGSGTLTITFQNVFGAAKTRALAVTYTTSDTLLALKDRIKHGIVDAALMTSSGTTSTDGLSVTVGGAVGTLNSSGTTYGANATISSSKFTIDVGASNKITALSDSRGNNTVSGSLHYALGFGVISGGSSVVQTLITTNTPGAKIQTVEQTDTITVTYTSTDTISSLTANIQSALQAAGTVGASSATTAAATATFASGILTIDTDGPGSSATATIKTITSSTDGSTANALRVALNLGAAPASATPASSGAIVQDKYRLDSVTISSSSSSSSSSSGSGTFSIGSQTSASTAIATVDAAIDQVSTARADLGALQNRLESAARSASIASVSASDAYARVVDADVATTMGDFVQAQIRQQASISILVQANSTPEVILQLLR